MSEQNSTYLCTIDQYETLKREIEENHGKRGNAERRQKLEALRERMQQIDSYRKTLREKLNSANLPDPRDQSHVKFVRESIDRAATAEVGRGVYAEITVKVTTPSPMYGEYGTGVVATIKKFLTHPRLKRFAAWRNAWTVIGRAVDFGILDEARFDSDRISSRRSSWESVNHDLYAYSQDGKLVLVQQRECENDGKYTNIKIRYFVTDGERAIELPNGKKQIVKRAAASDPSFDSPLRAVRSMLSEDWQAMIDATPVKFAAFGGTIKYSTGFKLLEQREGKLFSLWSRDYGYKLGRRECDKARDDHCGGLYYYRDAEQARALTTTNWGRSINQFVIVRCDVGGTTIDYGSKCASTYLRPVEIVETISA